MVWYIMVRIVYNKPLSPCLNQYQGHEGGHVLLPGFCCHLRAKPGNKAGTTSWPDLYCEENLQIILVEMCFRYNQKYIVKKIYF